MDLADLKDFVFSVKSALKNEISALIEMETEGEAQGWPLQFLSKKRLPDILTPEFSTHSQNGRFLPQQLLR